MKNHNEQKSDRDIKSWDKRLKDQVAAKWENYLKKRIDLSIIRADEIFLIAGEFLYVEKASSPAAIAAVKLNRNTNDSLELSEGAIIRTIFTQVYITNAQLFGEWLDVVYGINFEYYKSANPGEAQPAVIVTNAFADINTICEANSCTSALIRAHTTNTGLVWLDFGAAAVENACYPLEPGDAIQVPLSNTNRINCLFKVANERVTVIYQGA